MRVDDVAGNVREAPPRARPVIVDDAEGGLGPHELLEGLRRAVVEAEHRVVAVDGVAVLVVHQHPSVQGPTIAPFFTQLQHICEIL